MTNQAIQRVADASQAPITVTPMEILQRAVERGADIDQLTKLMDLQERWERNEAKKAFVAALGAFKADPPKIVKNKHVSFGGGGRGGTEYDHATLDRVCEVIGKALAEHGLSHTWKMKQGENALVTVTCTLTHQLGHSEETSLSAMPDNSGSKNPIQAVGSTVTYLQRYTLLAATGLAAGDMDDDGKGGGGGLIDAEQKDHLVALLKETGADVPRFLAWLGVASLDELPAADFDKARRGLEAKRSKK